MNQKNVTFSMRRFPGKIMVAAVLTLIAATSGQAITLEECWQLAHDNYPLIARYGLIEQTRDITISNLSKAYLPQVSVMAQATYQSKVAELPEMLRNVMTTYGAEVEGLKKDQYRVGVDINQSVWDGGAVARQKDVARAQSEVSARQNDVDMYAVRSRVNDMYFGILLVENRIKLNDELSQLLKANCDKMESMLKGGVVMQSDVDAVKAELLNTHQQATELASTKESLMRILGIFIGRNVEEIGELQKPEAVAPLSEDVSARPEMQLFDSRLRSLDARERQLDARLMPRISLFAQGFYGYPGYDMFADMMRHRWTLNGMIGARITWNIGGLYTRRNDKRQLAVQRDEVNTGREVFRFNNRIRTADEMSAYAKYQKLQQDDEEIIRLRESVRKAAESKLAHGIIDTNALLQEITRENNARIAQSTHEVEMLKHIYELKYITNK